MPAFTESSEVGPKKAVVSAHDNMLNYTLGKLDVPKETSNLQWTIQADTIGLARTLFDYGIKSHFPQWVSRMTAKKAIYVHAENQETFKPLVSDLSIAVKTEGGCSTNSSNNWQQLAHQLQQQKDGESYLAYMLRNVACESEAKEVAPSNKSHHIIRKWVDELVSFNGEGFLKHCNHAWKKYQFIMKALIEKAKTDVKNGKIFDSQRSRNPLTEDFEKAFYCHWWGEKTKNEPVFKGDETDVHFMTTLLDIEHQPSRGDIDNIIFYMLNIVRFGNIKQLKSDQSVIEDIEKIEKNLKEKELQIDQIDKQLDFINSNSSKNDKTKPRVGLNASSYWAEQKDRKLKVAQLKKARQDIVRECHKKYEENKEILINLRFLMKVEETLWSMSSGEFQTLVKEAIKQWEASSHGIIAISLTKEEAVAENVRPVLSMNTMQPLKQAFFMRGRKRKGFLKAKKRKF